MKRAETKYNKVVNFDKETKEITVFDKRYGLQGAIQKAFQTNDLIFQKECIKTLATQTGMRENFLKDNINQIKDL